VPEPVEIRPLLPADNERVRELFISGMQSMKPELPNEIAHKDLDNYLNHAISSDMADPYEHYVAGSSKSGFWVATYEGHVIGTVAISPSDADDDIAEVFRVSVDECRRRHGVAAQLMD
jgi:hypothetical protein